MIVQGKNIYYYSGFLFWLPNIYIKQNVLDS